MTDTESEAPAEGRPKADTQEEQEAEPVALHAGRGLRLAENVLYTTAGVVLLGGSAAVMGAVGYHLATEVGQGVEDAVAKTLDGLLLVFILLELLAGMRATMTERKLVAEPFLVVGIIASIKEIVVLTLASKDSRGKGQMFEDAMTEIGVLAGVILLLAIATYLVRRKEREPEED